MHRFRTGTSRAATQICLSSERRSASVDSTRRCDFDDLRIGDERRHAASTLLQPRGRRSPQWASRGFSVVRWSWRCPRTSRASNQAKKGGPTWIDAPQQVYALTRCPAPIARSRGVAAHSTSELSTMSKWRTQVRRSARRTRDSSNRREERLVDVVDAATPKTREPPRDRGSFEHPRSMFESRPILLGDFLHTQTSNRH